MHITREIAGQAFEGACGRLLNRWRMARAFLHAVKVKPDIPTERAKKQPTPEFDTVPAVAGSGHCRHGIDQRAASARTAMKVRPFGPARR